MMKKALYLSFFLCSAAFLAAQSTGILNRRSMSPNDPAGFYPKGVEAYQRPSALAQYRQNNQTLKQIETDIFDPAVAESSKYFKVDFDYHGNQQLWETRSESYWNPDINEWEINFQNDYWYLPNGLQDSFSSKEWDAAANEQRLIFALRQLYTPDERLTELRGYFPDPLSGVPTLSFVTTFTYNAQNQLIEEYRVQGTSKSKAEYTYDNNLLTEVTNFSLNELTSLWEPLSRSQYTYNSADLLFELESYSYDASSGAWIPNLKQEYLYDSEGREIQYTYSLPFDNNWAPYFRTLIDFSNNGALVEEVELEWSDVANDWAPVYKAAFQSNESVPASELNLPVHISQNAREARYFNYRLDSLFEYSYVDNNWSLDARTVVTWSPDLSNTQHLPDTDFALFPNPTGDLIHFQTERDLSGATFQLFDVHGRLQLQKELNHQQPVSAAGLPDGVYFYQLGKNGDWWVKGKAVISQQGR